MGGEDGVLTLSPVLRLLAKFVPTKGFQEFAGCRLVDD